MKLSTSLAITAALLLLCALSDSLLGTRYMVSTVLQPFPHLIILGVVFWDLLLWYRQRQTKARQSVPPRGKDLVDRVLLFVMAVYVFAVAGLVGEYLIRLGKK